jgi:23S rRNA (cytosine1962-C5)-methyltransferase
MPYPRIRLKRGSERNIFAGHPWVYSGAIAQAPPGIEAGSVVDICTGHDRFIGRGHYNPRSLIRARLLCRDEDSPIDAAFFAGRIARAVGLRRLPLLQDTTDACRLVHGESDGLPGLIVDEYAGFLVVQFHTYGMERSREIILDALEEVIQPRGIFERSDVGTRRAEGMDDRPSGPLRGEKPPELIAIKEGETQLHVDVYKGQKTGFFLDQRDNRLLLGRLAQGARVLNCFAFSGGFSAHALRGGATSVLDADIAPAAIPAARANWRANAGDGARANYLVADLFPYIETLAAKGPVFDVVVVDPPSLLRKRSDLKKAMGIYTKLNRNALKLVRNGGLLVSSSCSSRINQEDFFQIVRRAADGADVETRVLAYNLHPPDHPVDPAFPEGRYLKCIFARVLR